jgi:hypothetical protein
MNCEEFEFVVRDLARNEIADRGFDNFRRGDEHEPELVHVGACAACALRLQDERALSRRLDVLAAGMLPEAPPARIEAELLQAFRQTGTPSVAAAAAASQLSARAISGSAGILPAFPKSYWLTAAAAVMLIVLGMAVVLARLSGSQPGPDIRQAVEAGIPAQDTTPVPVAGPGVKEVVSGPASVSSSQDNHRLTARQGRSRLRGLRPPSAKRDSEASVAAASVTPPTAAEQAEPEVTTQFIALSYVAPANLQDGGQIVRVELPRSAMASFGVPVNMDRFGERVKADVFVSADGFARAIRFVQ